MKKTLLLAVLIAAAVSSLPGLEVIAGPKAIFGEFNGMGPDWDAKNKFSLSYGIGGFAKLQFTPLFSLQPEFHFRSISLKYEDSGPWDKYRHKAFSIPVYARFDFDVATIGAYALAGPRVDFLFGNVRYKNEGGTSSLLSLDILDYKKVTLGLEAGGGVSLPIGPGILDVGLDVYFGITSIRDSDSIYPWDLSTQIGYGFAL